MTTFSSLPRLVWIASKPPIPPFAGGTLKTHCGIRSLVCQTPVDLVTFAPLGEAERVRRELAAFWKDVPLNLHVVEYAPQPSPSDALRQGRFQFGLSIERSALGATLDTLDWQNPDRLLVFDDIVFAPLMPKYGRNAIFSPHDCISGMLHSHFQHAFPRPAALKIWAQYRIALAYEKEFYHQALLLHLVTHRDRVALEAINPRAVYHTLPFADQTGLATVTPDAYQYDILVWADLRIAAIASGAKAFLQASRDASASPGRRILLVGKTTRAQAEAILGADTLTGVEYAPYLEDEQGVMQHGKVTVIPDFGGAGIKSRCLSVLMAGKCLACLYEQMHGIEALCDLGAINAYDAPTLANRVERTLQEESYVSVARRGAEMFARQFSATAMRDQWIEMIQRAVVLRERSRAA